MTSRNSVLGRRSWEPWRTVFLVGFTVPLVAVVWFFSSGQPPVPPGRLEVRLREEALAIAQASGIVIEPTACTYLGKILTLDCKWPSIAEAGTLAALARRGWFTTDHNREATQDASFARGQDRAKLHCIRPPAVAECFLSLRLHLGE